MPRTVLVQFSASGALIQDIQELYQLQTLINLAVPKTAATSEAPSPAIAWSYLKGGALRSMARSLGLKQSLPKKQLLKALRSKLLHCTAAPPRPKPSDYDLKRLDKEIDDIISRLTSYIGWQSDTAVQLKTCQEIESLTLYGWLKHGNSWLAADQQTQLPAWVEPVIITGLPPRPEQRDYQVTLWSNYSITISAPDLPDLSVYYATVVMSLKRIYPQLEWAALTELTLLYYKQRSKSGSNWSPLQSYPDLMKLTKESFVLECFSGLLNNQEVVTALNRAPGANPLPITPITNGRLCLEAERLRALTQDSHILGSWPRTAWELLQRELPRGAVTLLVNPPYTETEIARTAKVLDEMFQWVECNHLSGLRVLMTLPNWPDIYQQGPLSPTALQYSRVVKNELITQDSVVNLSAGSAVIPDVNFSYCRLELGPN